MSKMYPAFGTQHCARNLDFGHGEVVGRWALVSSWFLAQTSPDPTHPLSHKALSMFLRVLQIFITNVLLQILTSRGWLVSTFNEVFVESLSVFSISWILTLDNHGQPWTTILDH